MEQQFNTIYSMFCNRVQETPDIAAYCERINNQWQPTSWQSLKDQVDYFASALMAHGFSKGDTVNILAGNRLVWPIADLGTIAAGGISAGIYPTNSAGQCEYIFKHSECKVLVVDTLDQLNKILPVSQSLELIIVKDPVDKSLDKVIQWDDFLEKGKANPQYLNTIQKMTKNSDPEDIVIIVYTSGTTGMPKGACLSNRYVLASCEALKHTVDAINAAIPDVYKQANEQPESLSFLPYCHVAERISGMYNRMYLGVTGYLVDDITKLYPYMLEVNPHSFAGLPRFFEKIYAKIKNDIETENGYDRDAFYRGVEFNKQVKQLNREGKNVPIQIQQAYEDAEKNIFSKIRGTLGNRIMSLTSGAAPIPEDVLNFFEYGANIPIYEAYGLTEFLCGAFNTPEARKPRSVGCPMYGAQIKIASDGEILFKGPLLFSGYYKDEAATNEAIDSDGWFHTGDIGKIDEDGFLFITGRKKEFIKTSTGKKISPLLLENLCKRNHVISNVMVFGDFKKYLTALITLNPDELKGYAKVNQIEYNTYEALTQHPEIIKMIESIVQSVNAQVSRTEQIKKFKVLTRDFSVDQEEITPTGKVKRKIVTARFKDVIDTMYA